MKLEDKLTLFHESETEVELAMYEAPAESKPAVYEGRVLGVTQGNEPEVSLLRCVLDGQGTLNVYVNSWLAHVERFVIPELLTASLHPETIKLSYATGGIPSLQITKINGHTVQPRVHVLAPALSSVQPTEKNASLTERISEEEIRVVSTTAEEREPAAVVPPIPEPAPAVAEPAESMREEFVADVPSVLPVSSLPTIRYEKPIAEDDANIRYLLSNALFTNASELHQGTGYSRRFCGMLLAEAVENGFQEFRATPGKRGERLVVIPREARTLFSEKVNFDEDDFPGVGLLSADLEKIQVYAAQNNATLPDNPWISTIHDEEGNAYTLRELIDRQLIKREEPKQAQALPSESALPAISVAEAFEHAELPQSTSSFLEHTADADTGTDSREYSLSPWNEKIFTHVEGAPSSPKRAKPLQPIKEDHPKTREGKITIAQYDGEGTLEQTVDEQTIYLSADKQRWVRVRDVPLNSAGVANLSAAYYPLTERNISSSVGNYQATFGNRLREETDWFDSALGADGNLVVQGKQGRKLFQKQEMVTRALHYLVDTGFSSSDPVPAFREAESRRKINITHYVGTGTIKGGVYYAKSGKTHVPLTGFNPNEHGVDFYAHVFDPFTPAGLGPDKKSSYQTEMREMLETQTTAYDNGLDKLGKPEPRKNMRGVKQRLRKKEFYNCIKYLVDVGFSAVEELQAEGTESARASSLDEVVGTASPAVEDASAKPKSVEPTAKSLYKIIPGGEYYSTIRVADLDLQTLAGKIRLSTDKTLDVLERAKGFTRVITQGKYIVLIPEHAATMLDPRLRLDAGEVKEFGIVEDTREAIFGYVGKNELYMRPEDTPALNGINRFSIDTSGKKFIAKQDLDTFIAQLHRFYRVEKRQNGVVPTYKVQVAVLSPETLASRISVSQEEAASLLTQAVQEHGFAAREEQESDTGITLYLPKGLEKCVHEKLKLENKEYTEEILVQEKDIAAYVAERGKVDPTVLNSLEKLTFDEVTYVRLNNLKENIIDDLAKYTPKHKKGKDMYVHGNIELYQTEEVLLDQIMARVPTDQREAASRLLETKTTLEDHVRLTPGETSSYILNTEIANTVVCYLVDHGIHVSRKLPSANGRVWDHISVEVPIGFDEYSKVIATRPVSVCAVDNPSEDDYIQGNLRITQALGISSKHFRRAVKKLIKADLVGVNRGNKEYVIYHADVDAIKYALENKDRLPAGYTPHFK